MNRQSRVEQRLTGRVKKHFPDKGFGFIEAENGDEFFVHITKMIEGSILEADKKVEFTPTKTTKGMQAFDVITIN